MYRNGVKLLRTPNDGTHTDNINKKGTGTYDYLACAAVSNGACTNVAKVVF